jgi:c-di-GMP-binding flagellar brake protein YcgR
MSAAQEKRRHARFSFSMPMRYKRIEKDARDFKGSLIRNLSAGGAQIKTFEFLPLNAKLAVEISLLNGVQPVKGICRVAWVRKTAFSEQYDTGVEFVDFNQENTEQIAKFIFDKNTEK